jgi:hypothetical protein
MLLAAPPESVPVTTHTPLPHATLFADPENVAVFALNQLEPLKLYLICPCEVTSVPVATHTRPFHATLHPDPENPPEGKEDQLDPSELYRIVLAGVESRPTATNIIPFHATPDPAPEKLPFVFAFVHIDPSLLHFKSFVAAVPFATNIDCVRAFVIDVGPVI